MISPATQDFLIAVDVARVLAHLDQYMIYMISPDRQDFLVAVAAARVPRVPKPIHD